MNLIRFLTLLRLPDLFSIPQIIKFENIFFSRYENGRNDNSRNENINPGFEGGTSSVLSLIFIYGHREHRVNYKIETVPLGRQIAKKIPFSFSLEAGPRAQGQGLGKWPLVWISPATWGLVFLYTVHLYMATL